MPTSAAMPARLTVRTPCRRASSRAAPRMASRRCSFCSGRRARLKGSAVVTAASLHSATPFCYYQNGVALNREGTEHMPQVFFLTGSSRGLGHPIAEAALAAGHQLVATARRPDALADLAGRYGSRILPVALDVTDPDAAVAAVTAGAGGVGRVRGGGDNAGSAQPPAGHG